MTDFSTSYTILSLLDVHPQLDELFLRHQEALLALDIVRAKELLLSYQRAVLAHMRDEDELILPRFADSGAAPRGSLDLLADDHETIKRMVAQFLVRVDEVARDPTPRAVIGLITEQAAYKDLMARHDQQEREVLYPSLDRIVATAEQRTALAARLVDSSAPRSP